METKKRIYIGLMGISLAFLVVLLLLLWYLISHKEIIINQIVLISVAAAAAVMLFIMGLGVLSLVLMIMRAKSVPSLQYLSRWVNELLFPLAITIGQVLGIDKSKILKSFISVNNYIVSSNKLFNSRVLILLPHCLQNAECKHKITTDINNCRNCGKCSVGQLKEIGEKYGAVIKVATGGTLARKWVEEVKPSAIIAIACERDLASGIQDTAGLPVFGILNVRPFGPCFNTDVDIKQVDCALRLICEGGY